LLSRQGEKDLRFIDAGDCRHHFVVQPEVPRQYSDDGARLSIERDASPDDNRDFGSSRAHEQAGIGIL
jgi:hypothetical protein